MPTDAHANKVRTRCKLLIKKAREKGELVIAFRAGDLHKDLEFVSRLPLVCSVLGSNRFDEENGIKRIAIDGPTNGANALFVYKLDR